MNWNKLILVSSVALATVALPFATAQAQGRGGRGGGRHVTPSASGPSVQQPGRGAGNNGGNRWRDGSGNRNRWSNGSGNNRWRHHDGRWHHRHHRHHRSHFYTGFYPYGYGYPFGYGYGFPYFGASAALYHNGYNRGYARRGNNVVVEVQQELARAGYYRGLIDGVIGNGTRGAIRAYERANGLPVDGRIDRDLLENMGLS